jgi:hypothetical protein
LAFLCLPIMQIGWIGSYREVNFSRAFSTLAGLQRERISELASDRKHSVASQGLADLGKPAHGSVTTVGTFTRAPPLYFPDHGVICFWRGVSWPSLFINFSKVSNFAQRRDEKRFHAGGPVQRLLVRLPLVCRRLRRADAQEVIRGGIRRVAHQCAALDPAPNRVARRSVTAVARPQR